MCRSLGLRFSEENLCDFAMPALHLRLVGLLLWFSVAGLIVLPAEAQTCATRKFSNNKLFQHCSDLPTLSSSLHWTHDADGSLSIAFVAPPAKSDGWISWAINPTGSGMIGAQSLIAFKQTDGSMTVRPYRLNNYQSVEQKNLTLEVSDMSAESSGGQMMIFATFRLPANWTTVNQVWQVGSTVTDGRPIIHDTQTPNLNAKGTLDLVGGQTGTNTGGDSRIRKRNIHGILNAVSWGILFPVGVILARYLRTFESADPAWFYLHAGCQSSAYAIGVAGWATGLQLGSKSKGIQYTTHRNIGIALFSLATVQIFALFLRPKKEHKFRFYWNIYHHGVGYAILILGILNVFKGLDILDPAKKWKSAYIIVIAILGGIALFLELITWAVVLKRKSRKSTMPYNGQQTT
ncbi:cytochrome b561 and DOMON domain-containing protein At4g12980-like [Vitis vinifera]|nr:cytochrome b561 and DOMON domain-containing protein At4g12980-like [Vitis vinifera]